ncbi:hypothetical protein NI25_13520 [Streptomyces sp. CCM_MD2014]|nr:hypothetical protein NI25_13520 [Streptomyces sp. CCM_MD2014]
MSVDAGTGQVDEPGREVDRDDDWAPAVITTAGRRLRLRREAAGMRAPGLAAAIGYGKDLAPAPEARVRFVAGTVRS